MNRRQIVIASSMASMMVGTGAAAGYFKPNKLLADERDGELLSSVVPTAFSGWKEIPGSASVVDPRQEVLLNKIYSEVLSRTYIGENNAVIMLMISYGKNQRDDLQVHRPDICYPAQGFEVLKSRDTIIDVGFTNLPVRQLKTSLHETRHEPVTYWVTIGDYIPMNDVQKKLYEIKYALDRKVPDGMLVRVSSIDSDEERAFNTQKQFIFDMLASLDRRVVTRFVGVGR